MTLFILIKLLVLLCSIGYLAMPALASKRPNILFILTDDQDWHMDSLVSPCPVHWVPSFAKVTRMLATHALTAEVRYQ